MVPASQGCYKKMRQEYKRQSLRGQQSNLYTSSGPTEHCCIAQWILWWPPVTAEVEGRKTFRYSAAENGCWLVKTA